MSKSKVFRSIIMGAPASGKGTISSRVIKHFDIQHISSGDILRSHMLNNTELGKDAKGCVEAGQLVPDKIMIDVIRKELGQKRMNWLLDGFPRTRPQAEELFKEEPIDVALNLVVPFDLILKRVEGRWIHPCSGRIYNTVFCPPKIAGKDDLTGEDLVQRPDDQPEAVEKRLHIYSLMIEPVVQFYEELGVLKNFHGETSDIIWPQVFNYLSNFMEPKLQIGVGPKTTK